ncbi:MAG: histidine kinase [Bacteroidota bacterium]
MNRIIYYSSKGLCLRIGLFLFFYVCASFLFAQNIYYEKYGIKDGLPSSEFYDLIEDKDGYLWFTSDRGVVRYNYYEFEVFGIQDGLSNMVNFSFHQVSDSTFWLNGYDGTFTFWDGSCFIPFKFNKELQEYKEENHDWYEINNIDDQFIWFVKGNQRSNRQYKINRQNGKIHFNEVLKLSCSKYCSAKTIRLISHYNIFINTPNKRVLKNTRSSIFSIAGGKRIKYDDPNTFIINETVYDDNIWVLTSKGIEIRKQDQPNIKINELNLNAVISSVIIVRNNELWATSTSDGIFRIPNPTIQLKKFDNTIDKNVNSIHKIGDKVYIRTFDLELFEIGTDGIPKLIINNLTESITNIYEGTDQNKLFIGNYEISNNTVKGEPTGQWATSPLSANVYLYDAYKLINFYNEDLGDSSFLLEHPIKALSFVFKNDVAYIGGNEGMYQINFNQEPKPLKVDTILSGMRVNDLIVENNEIWAGTMGNGLWHCTDGNCAQVNINFRNLVIHSIHKSDKGLLWIGTNNSLIKTEYTKNSADSILIRKVASFSTNDGLPSNYIKDIESKNDTLWIATDNGLALMSLFGNYKKILPPVLDIKSVKFNNSTFANQNNTYRVPHDLNDLKVTYTAISSDKPIFPENTYRYKVIKDGSTNINWTFTNSRTVELSNQPSGKYTFTIQSQNSSGMWSRPEEIAYEILPHFTQTIPFKLGVLSVLILIVVLIYRLRSKQLKKRLSLELRLKTSELNILRNQMNPHFIFNSINAVQSYIFSDMKAEANLYIHSLSKLIRKSLKFSQFESISLSDEIEFIREYLLLEQMRFETLFEFTIQCDTALDKDLIKIPALVVQPIVENAIKHAFKGMKNQGKILIDYAIQDKTVQVTVSDNGKGMKKEEKNTSDEYHQSMGLKIVRQRLNLINEKLKKNIAGIQITSTSETGTHCLITLPIKSYES